MAGSRWIAATLSTILLAAPAGTAQDSTDKSPSVAPSLDLQAMPAHETLEYEVEWKLITAGTARFTYTAMPHSAVASSEVKLHLESAGLVSRFYRVNDDYTAMLGQNFCVESTLLAAREGSRNKETRVSYDPKTRKASYLEKDLVNNAPPITHEFDIPSCVHDVIGGLMALRTLNLEPGKTAQIILSDGKKAVPVKIECQRREDVKPPIGAQKTIRYEVFLFNNVLYKRPGRLYVWLTDDKRRLPVQLQVRLQFTIGTITFRLVKEEKS